MVAKFFKRLTRKEVLTILFFAPVVMSIGWWLPGKIDVVTSDSISYRIFFLGPVPEKIKVGDYIVFKYNHGYKFLAKSLTKHSLFTKEVGCGPGDLLAVDVNRRFTCDGNPLGQALKADSHGNPLPLFSSNGIIPPDNYFALGINPRSFDSKYFGFIKKNEILYKAYPIW